MTATLMDAVDLTAAIADVAALLTTSCTVGTPTENIGAAGGRAYTYSATSTTCRVSQASNADRLLFPERLANVVGWSVILPYATTVDVKSRITVGSAVYEVIGVEYNPTFPMLKRAICVEVR